MMGSSRFYYQSTNRPNELINDIKNGKLNPVLLASAAEFLGFASLDIVKPMLLELLKHHEPCVRIGACFGAMKHPCFEVFKILEHIEKHDDVSDVRLAAKDTLDVWLEMDAKGTEIMQEKIDAIANGTNKVELIEYCGSDLGHALSAWTSTSRTLTDEKRARVPALLKRLATDKHHTVFEKSYFRFLITVDCATHIQLLKHRIGVSINGESARYKELKDDKYYVPQDWETEDQVEYIEHVEQCLVKYHEVIAKLLAKGMDKRRVKESARFYLPYGNQIVMDVSFNFRSFMHYQELRNSGHAQLEIRELSKDMLKLISKIGDFDQSLDAFGWTKEKINVVI
jgi:flavin-dependent thymidylate synthase